MNKLNFELKIVPVTKIAELKEQTRYVHHARASKKKRNIKQLSVQPHSQQESQKMKSKVNSPLCAARWELIMTSKCFFTGWKRGLGVSCSQ